MNRIGSLKNRKNLIPLLYCLPGVLIMTLFVLLPIGLSVVMSLFRIPSLGAAWEFTGLFNYAAALRENQFTFAFLRTIGFGAWGIVTGFALALFTSFLIAKHRLLSFYRYVFYLPAIVSAITMGKIWNLMLTPNSTGLLNVVARVVFGAQEPINWLGSTDIAYLVVLGMGLIGCGGGMALILFTTAINDVPQELQEAASIEGAGAFQRAFRITIPLIWPVISSWLLLSIIGSFKTCENIYALTGGGPGQSTTTLAILLYNNSQNSVFGYGSSAAMGVILTLIVMVFAIFYLRVAKFGRVED